MRTFSYYFTKTMLFLTTLIVVGMSPLYGGQAVTTANPAAGQSRLKKVQELSLAREQKRQEKSAGVAVDTRSLAEVEDQTKPNTFTQTEAYFQLPALRELVTKTFYDSFEVVRHMDIVSRVMAKEAQFRNTHWAFYHTMPVLWTVPQDLYTQLYNAANPSAQNKDGEFTFLRFNDQSGPQAKEFLVNELKENGLVDDNGKARGLLLSTNLSLFGNTGFPSECSWNYLMKEKAHTAPTKEIYEEILTKFGASHEYVTELMSLVDLLHTKEDMTLLQIFVPKDVIDEIGYLAWATGIPAHEESINWVKTNVKNKVYKGKAGKPGALWALAGLGETYKKEQEKNPMFKDLLQSVKEGDYSLDAYLKIYCNRPWDLPNINYVQARLIFSTDVLLNPESGIKMFRHTTIDREKIEEYEKRLDAIIKKIVATKGTRP